MNFPMKSPFLSQRSSICLYIFTGKRMPWAFTWGVNASFTPRKVQARRCHASGIAMAHRNTWWTYIKMMDLPIYLWNQGDFPVRYTKNYRSSWFGAIEWGWNHPNLGPFLSTVDVRWNWFISTTATGTMVDIWTVGWKKHLVGQLRLKVWAKWVAPQDTKPSHPISSTVCLRVLVWKSPVDVQFISFHKDGCVFCENLPWQRTLTSHGL